MDRCKAIKEFCSLIIARPNNIEFAVHQLFSPNISLSSPLGEEIGRQGLIHHLQMWLSAFTDLKIKQFEVDERDRTVVVVWSVTGTHSGTFAQISPTYQALDFGGIAIWEFDDQNQVIQLTYRADMLGFFKQLGFYLEKAAYPMQSKIKGNRELLIKKLMKFNADKDLLTRSEVICLTFYINGMTAKQIAEGLKRSYRTVQVHIANAMDKLGCSQKLQLFDLMCRKGLKHVFRDLYDLLQD